MHELQIRLRQAIEQVLAPKVHWCNVEIGYLGELVVLPDNGNSLLECSTCGNAEMYSGLPLETVIKTFFPKEQEIHGNLTGNMPEKRREELGLNRALLFTGQISQGETALRAHKIAWNVTPRTKFNIHGYGFGMNSLFWKLMLQTAMENQEYLFAGQLWNTKRADSDWHGNGKTWSALYLPANSN